MYRGLNVYFSPRDDAYVAIGTQLANPYFQQFPKGANLRGETREQYLAKYPSTLSNSLTGLNPYAQQQPQAEPAIAPVAQPQIPLQMAAPQAVQQPPPQMAQPAQSVRPKAPKKSGRGFLSKFNKVPLFPEQVNELAAPSLQSPQMATPQISPAERNELQAQAAEQPQVPQFQMAAPQRYVPGLEEPYVEEEQKHNVEQAMQAPVAYEPEMKRIAEYRLQQQEKVDPYAGQRFQQPLEPISAGSILNGLNIYFNPKTGRYITKDEPYGNSQFTDPPPGTIVNGITREQYIQGDPDAFIEGHPDAFIDASGYDPYPHLRQKQHKNLSNADKQLKAWNSMHPLERQQISINKQAENLMHRAEVNQYNQEHQIFSNQQMQQDNIPPALLHELMNSAQNQQTRYIPTKPRKSINARVMSSFDPRMFSPEFIPEEGNGY